eukprot:gnl/MRDRNA2_/MRDRNA2_82501_c0_seq2.p1 gnl/MRDRNA2_/MRDRNA2_82501_c0~~gnl/MRDRNA2_/MRDRNA2_82501_c0_seq2.p1  ORF type:complete len:795 (+),score=113.06 gnl/MRDRNA2_/MRDRNA2_82501_c0_seq2:127-2511(+)
MAKDNVYLHDMVNGSYEEGETLIAREDAIHNHPSSSSRVKEHGQQNVQFADKSESINEYGMLSMQVENSYLDSGTAGTERAGDRGRPRLKTRMPSLRSILNSPSAKMQPSLASSKSNFNFESGYDEDDCNIEGSKSQNTAYTDYTESTEGDQFDGIKQVKRKKTLYDPFKSEREAKKASQRQPGGKWLPKGGGRTLHVLELQELIRSSEAPQQKKQKWIHSTKADIVCGIIIFVNSLFVGISVQLKAMMTEEEHDEAKPYIMVVESTFLVLFLIEIAMRINGDGLSWCFTKWGMFDTSVTLLGVLDAWLLSPLMGGGDSGEETPLSSFTVLRIIRVVRIARLARLIRAFRGLGKMTSLVGETLRAAMWISFMLIMCQYTSSVFVTISLAPGPGSYEYVTGTASTSENDEFARKFSKRWKRGILDDDDMINLLYTYFGNLGRTGWTHFMLVTTDGWIHIAETAVKATGNKAWYAYFLLNVFVTNFCLLSTLVSIISVKMIEVDDDELPREDLHKLIGRFRKVLTKLFEMAHIPEERLKWKELKPKHVRWLFELKECRNILKMFDVSVDLPFETIWTILDPEHLGRVPFEVLLDRLIRLRGSRDAKYILWTQSDFMSGIYTIARGLEHVQHTIDKFEARESDRVQRVNELLQQRTLLLEKLHSKAIGHRRASCTIHLWQSETAGHLSSDEAYTYQKFVEEPSVWTEKVAAGQHSNYGLINSPRHNIGHNIGSEIVSSQINDASGAQDQHQPVSMWCRPGSSEKCRQHMQCGISLPSCSDWQPGVQPQGKHFSETPR